VAAIINTVVVSFIIWSLDGIELHVSLVALVIFICLIIFNTTLLTPFDYLSTIQLSYHHSPILSCIIYLLIFYVVCVME